MAYQFTQTGAEIQDILDLAQLQIAAPYDSASSYTAGDYCTKDDGFYVCTASTSGTWDASKWSAVTVGDVLETANANISSLNATLTNIAPIVDGVRMNTGNVTTYSFSGLRHLTGATYYRYGLLYAAPSASGYYLGMVFVNTTNSASVTTIATNTSYTFTASVSGDTLTITASTTLWAGLRLLWFN